MLYDETCKFFEALKPKMAEILHWQTENLRKNRNRSWTETISKKYHIWPVAVPVAQVGCSDAAYFCRAN